ncbi:uncharacterized protein PV06_00244 [Exophiala oligosperma]|uniref:Ubiquitin-like protease family profile domain-containing protein n=1 Tax=Exophiala oligosperma TaxID=215243 RepID=A0A0D2EHZ1_9EURO|nr:uncharacterized protein PV06_00244 [Exophiala oligosperma]KIW47554.1 hypothetical protein PV06_00244 [Exophiala oligosperma]
MADSSSFMDWSPATPEPRFNPYPENYVPGGWPEPGPQVPPPTTGVFARRPPPSGFVQTAKRVCRGLGAVITGGFHLVVQEPTYAIVRRVRERQRRQPRPQPQREVRTATPPRQAYPPPQFTLSDSPWNRAVTLEEARRRVRPPPDTFDDDERRRKTPTPSPKQPQLQPRPPPKDRVYHIPNFLPNGTTRYSRKSRVVTAAIAEEKTTSAPSIFADMPHFPAPVPELPDHPIPHKIERIFPVDHRKLSNTPQLKALTSTNRPPSPETYDEEEETGTLMVEIPPELDKGDESDTSLRSYQLRPKKLRIRKNRAIKHSDTKKDAAIERIDTPGPSLRVSKAPTTPTPAIVVQETGTVITQSPVPVDEDLLSPPRVRYRRVSTPKQNKFLFKEESPGSEISSTCECSPGNQTPQPTKFTTPIKNDSSSAADCSLGDPTPRPQATSPQESDISSMFIGSPPDLEADEKLFKMIMAAGGRSPTPVENKVATNEKAQENRPVKSDPAILEDKKVATNEQSAPVTSDPAILENQKVVTNEPSEPTTSDAAPRSTIIDTTPEDTTTPKAESETNGETIPPQQSETVKEQKQDRNLPIEIEDDDAPTTQIDGPHAGSFAAPTTPTQRPPEVKAEHATSETRPQTVPSTPEQNPVKNFAQLTIQDPFTPDVPTPKASPHSAERTQRVTRAEAKRLASLQEHRQYEIVALTEEWEKKIQQALRSGHGEYKPTDLIRVVPLLHGRGTDSWLNDEVINGYLKIIVEHGKKNDRPTQVPTHHAFVSFFFNNLAEKGYDSVKRWANRAKIGGKRLLETEQVFIPINRGMHWTLCVVSGKNKTITHYNSLGGNGRTYVETIKKWVKEELGSAYNEEEWIFDYSGETPHQTNMDDCGVFTITSARQIMLGLTPMSYNADQIQLQRRRIVAELMNGALLKSSE